MTMIHQISEIFHNLEKKYPKYVGLTYCFIGCLMFACVDLLIKMAHTVPTFQIYYLASFFSIFILYPIAWYSKINLVLQNETEYKFMHLRCLCGGLSMVAIYESFKMISLTEAIVLANTSPLWAPIICYFLMKDPLLIKDVMYALICCFGLIFIAKPEGIFGKIENESQNNNKYINPSLQLVGFALCLIASVFRVLNGICIKRLPKNLNPLIIVFYFNVANTVIGGIAMSFSGIKFLTLYEIFIIFLNSVSFILGQLLYSRSIQIEKVGHIMILLYSQIVWDFIFDIFFLNTILDTFSLIGCGIIVTSLIIFVLQKN